MRLCQISRIPNELPRWRDAINASLPHSKGKGGVAALRVVMQENSRRGAHFTKRQWASGALRGFVPISISSWFGWRFITLQWKNNLI